MDDSMTSEDQPESTSGFATLATLELPNPSRLLPNSCCPDKDLAVLISQAGEKEKLSLWKLQGVKKWEVDVAAEGVLQHRIVAIAWSPDTQSIAIAHDPPCVTIHSVQDGHEERLLNLTVSPSNEARLCDIGWFEHTKPEAAKAAPDIFRRQDVITGSAHSIFRMLPLLDPIQDNSQPLTATELFAFQGIRATAQANPTVPEVITSWPSLPSDPLLASIQPSALDNTHDTRPGEELDVRDATNRGSLLVISDTSGGIRCFLDGSYPLGSFNLVNHTACRMHKDLATYTLFGNFTGGGTRDIGLGSLRPFSLHYPELESPVARRLAQLATSARELVWYMKQLLRDAKSLWYGSDHKPGARDLGPKWITTLADKIRRHGGYGPQAAMLQLTTLLLTGKRSEPLEDMLASGEHTSERSLTKWESTVREAVVKMRDDCERRLSPACQRLHLILQDFYGFSKMSRYQVFRLDSSAVFQCLDLTGRALILFSWMASNARNELSRATHFIAWLRYGTADPPPMPSSIEKSHDDAEVARTHTGDPPPAPPPLRHDVLRVNEYLVSGLEQSPLDRFFTGPIPRFTLQDIGVPRADMDLAATMARARLATQAPSRLLEPPSPPDLLSMECNIDALLDEITRACRAICIPVAEAASRSAVLVASPSAPPASERVTVVVRERSVAAEVGFTRHLLLRAPTPSDGPPLLCFARFAFGTPAPSPIEFTLYQCELDRCDDPDTSPVGDVDGVTELLDADFFDDHEVVMLCRTSGEEGVRIARARYHELAYAETAEADASDMILSHSDLWSVALTRWRARDTPPDVLHVAHSQPLVACAEGFQTMALNGRDGRRVACVLNSAGTALEVLDLATGDSEDEIEETDAPMVGQD